MSVSIVLLYQLRRLQMSSLITRPLEMLFSHFFTAVSGGFRPQSLKCDNAVLYSPCEHHMRPM